MPQDSVLFNASIGYNIGYFGIFSACGILFTILSIRYGKFGSTLEEIEAAARSAQMHDRIMSFPEGMLYGLLQFYC